MIRVFKTNKGTELPLLNLRGKEYLEVKYRLVWFREEHPGWSIETEFISLTEKSVCAKAVIRDDSGKVVSTSHKFETVKEFPDFMEKAETGAIGRALALIGYGTQFCADDLDEGKRIVDSPVSREHVVVPQATVLENSVQEQEPTAPNPAQLGDFEIQFGRKYRGRKLKDIPEREIQGYVAWLESEAEKKGTPISHDAKILKYAVEQFHRNKAAAAEESVFEEAESA